MTESLSSEKNLTGFMLRAFRYPNYRLFFGGQLISLVGTWMSTTAGSWLVYRLSGSAWMLGVVGFASQLPAFLISPVAGVFVDRWNRHRLLMITQVLSMLQSFALAALILSGRVTIPAIIALSIFQGIVNAFDMPTRQAFVVTLIENREDLGNAIALNSSMFNAARLLGPSLAGFIIATANEGWCFLIDGVSYLAVLAALAAMKVAPRPVHTDSTRSAFSQFKDGLRYASNSVPIRSIILLLALMSLVGIPYGVLVPVFAGPILHGGPYTLGFLMTASGLGALSGALWLASRKSVIGLGRIVPMMAGLFGVGLILFSFSRSVWLSMILMTVTGFGFMVQMASSNTILQTIVDDDMRGRIMSLYVMAFLGTAPFGSLIAGALADRIGAPSTLLIGGFLCLGGSLWFARRLPALREAVRPIYIRKGILPQVATAIQTADRLTFPPEE